MSWLQVPQQIGEIHSMIALLLERVQQMEVTEAEFDTALTQFLTEITSTLAAIQAKLDAAGAHVDLTDELKAITDAKSALDAFVAKNP